MASSVSSAHFLIDQQVEVAKNFLQSNLQSITDNNLQELTRIVKERNALIDNAKSTGSYQVILQQSLTTQDKPFLYEILIENDPTIIQNSLIDLRPKRVIELLKMIKLLLEQHIKLGKGQDHCLSIASWLQTLIRLHLTTIVANVENKQTILSIKKFLLKKTSRKSQLKEIKSHLLSEQSAQQLQDLSQRNGQRKNPKFQYIEEEKEHIQEEQQQNEQGSEINDQDMQGLELDDLDMDEFMDDDF